MNKQGYVICHNRNVGEFFTASSAYDRPQWVSLKEATVYPTPELAQAASKKLWQYGAYSAASVLVQEALDKFKDEIDPALDDDPSLDDPEKDPSLEGLPPEDVETLSEPVDDESAYGADGELDGEEGISAMGGEEDPEFDPDAEPEDELGLGDELDPPSDESAYGADGELDGEEGISAMDSEEGPEGGSFELEMPDDENGNPDENDENAISPIELRLMKKKPTMEAVDHNGDRVFQTYAAWKRAVKAINPSAEFYGDEDIGGAKGIGEWDGETGLIFAKALRDKWASEKTNESILIELSSNTLKSYLGKAVASTNQLVKQKKMVKGVDRAKKAVWASQKIKEKKVLGEADTGACGTNEYTNKPGCDKVKVPSSIKSALSDVVAKFKQSANKADTRDDVRASQDLTVADALQQLLDDLSSGTLEGMKQAQIHMTSYMTPISQHIPPEVVKFIAKGGRVDSLKDMFNAIKETTRTSIKDL